MYLARLQRDELITSSTPQSPACFPLQVRSAQIAVSGFKTQSNPLKALGQHFLIPKALSWELSSSHVSSATSGQVLEILRNLKGSIP